MIGLNLISDLFSDDKKTSIKNLAMNIIKQKDEAKNPPPSDVLAPEEHARIRRMKSLTARHKGRAFTTAMSGYIIPRDKS